MDFEQALTELKNGNKITNMNWNGKDMYLEMQIPDTNSKMSSPYIYIKTADGNLVPWLASQGDLFSEEWEIVPQEQEIELVLPKTYLECGETSCTTCYMGEFRLREDGASVKITCQYRQMLNMYF